MVPFREIEIEDYIWDKIRSNIDDLSNRGLEVEYGHYYRQFKLPGCGIVDLISFSPCVRDGLAYVAIIIYELKRGPAKPCDVTQLARYYSYLLTHREEIEKRISPAASVIVKPVLIASDFDRDVLCFDRIYHNDLAYVKYKVDLGSGICFEYVPSDYFDGQQVNFSEVMPDKTFGWIETMAVEIELQNAMPPREIGEAFPF